jgi:hypothetical protein
MKILIFLAMFIVAVSSYKDDIYCKLCTNHIACNHTGTYSPACPAGTLLIPLTDTDKQNFIDTHNQIRNQVASGNLSGFDPAVAMKTAVS